MLAAAITALDVTPDVLLVDATGSDHPRRAGLAVHLGAVTAHPDRRRDAATARRIRRAPGAATRSDDAPLARRPLRRVLGLHTQRRPAGRRACRLAYDSRDGRADGPRRVDRGRSNPGPAPGGAAGGPGGPGARDAAISLGVVGSRLARDDEVDAWREDGWVVLEGLIGTDEIDAAARRPGRALPGARGVPRRPRGRDRAVARPPGRRARDLHLAAGRPGLPARAAPVVEPVPPARCHRAQPADRAPVDRRLRGARAGDGRRPHLPGAGDRQVHRAHQLRAAHAHRPEPLVAARRSRAAVVPRRGVPLPVRRRRRHRADAPRAAPATPPATNPHSRSVCPSATPSCSRRSARRPGSEARSSRTATTSSTAPSTSPRRAGRASC